MKFSEQWLREWLDTGMGRDELLERLTMSGLEVDGVEPVAPSFSGVVVARVEKVEPHPDADKLRVCQVEYGQPEPATIVCGAANVKAGGCYPLATSGAVLPGNHKIKTSKLRGVTSQGMLCSGKELGLAEEAEGLMTLDDKHVPGTDIREALQLDDSIIELSLTPNRGDCLGIAGIARDAAALSNAEYQSHVVDAVSPAIDAEHAIHLESPSDCPRYAGRLIKNINAAAVTPLWMQERLRRSGIRCINIVVDITNYVMLELGQPMHAFDAGCIDTGVRVRHAGNGEKLTLLDGQEYDLLPESLVIADAKRPLALAGIMGGEDSAVTETTQHIFLESAYFQPLSILGKARQYGLHTDSSHRFERGVDYRLQERAIERATALVIELCGGDPGPVQLEEAVDELPERTAIPLRRDRIARVLGITIGDERVHEILTALEMQVDETADGWLVTPPSFRFDIEIEADLIEELARVTGYDNINGTDCGATPAMHPPHRREEFLADARRTLLNRGYQEAIVYSFIDPQLQSLFEPEIEPLALANPIASDLGVMRTSLVAGLVQALQYNLNRQQERVRLFESGLIYRQEKALEQTDCLAGLVYGPVLPVHWSAKGRLSDFYDLKSDVESLLRAGGSFQDARFLPASVPYLHPGQSSQVVVDGKVAGVLGVLHPRIAQKLEISGEVLVFELKTSLICSDRRLKFKEFPRFPSVRRDISLLVGESVPVAEIINIIEESASDLLSNLELFDVYQGEGIEIGKKSLTFGLTFQRSSSTLIDSEVDSRVGDVLNALHTHIGATLRE